MKETVGVLLAIVILVPVIIILWSVALDFLRGPRW